MSISQTENEILAISNIIKTINKAREYFHNHKNQNSTKLPKLLSFCDIAFRNWRTAELSLQIAQKNSPELEAQVSKWKNITKIYHCPDHVKKTIDTLSHKERQEIIQTIAPLCKEFVQQTTQIEGTLHPLPLLKNSYSDTFLYEKKKLSRVNS